MPKKQRSQFVIETYLELRNALSASECCCPAPVQGLEKIPKISKNWKQKTEVHFRKTLTKPQKVICEHTKPATNCSWSGSTPLPLLLRLSSLSLRRRLLNGLSGNHWHRARNDNNNKSSNNTQKKAGEKSVKDQQTNRRSSGKNWEQVEEERNCGEFRGTERN